jgi:type III pantothenate kinase
MLGADRIVNSVAAVAKYPAPLIIIDCGTATTFCAVSDKNEYLGGAIAPGLKISSEALFEKTAKLPRVEIEVPKKAICHNTTEGMQAGLVFGHIGMAEYIVKRMKDEIRAVYGSDKPITVIGTGGMAYIIKDNSDCIDVLDKMLTLEGLLLIYEKNKSEERTKPEEKAE